MFSAENQSETDFEADTDFMVDLPCGYNPEEHLGRKARPQRERRQLMQFIHTVENTPQTKGITSGRAGNAQRRAVNEYAHEFNGIGSGHDSDVHHVTNCMHDHAHYRKQEGVTGAGASGMEAQAMEMMQKQEGELSLSAWLDRMLGKGKRFFHGIWNGSRNGVAGSDGEADAAQVMAQVGDVSTAAQSGVSPTGRNTHQTDTAPTAHISQITAASSAVTLPKEVQENPYFSAINDAGGQNGTLLQKMKVKFKDITGHLPGNFFSARNRDSFRAKQEKPKEDLRKHSRFHGDDLEIDCILTDDSYLLDSYDRKGEYSKLSAKK
ncbi:MAG TPA: hypothetical protein DCZ91_14025 [Lachnospiraceae bacterium]|nr:hypothetical protein [Lachnospiraceae bacterium]